MSIDPHGGVVVFPTMLSALSLLKLHYGISLLVVKSHLAVAFHYKAI